jgi:hypothetical protein
MKHDEKRRDLSKAGFRVEQQKTGLNHDKHIFHEFSNGSIEVVESHLPNIKYSEPPSQ